MLGGGPSGARNKTGLKKKRLVDSKQQPRNYDQGLETSKWRSENGKKEGVSRGGFQF